MSFKNVVQLLLLGTVTLSLVAVITPSAAASHIDWEQRRAQREAEREARRLARENPSPTCRCSASLGLARPSLQFTSGGGLTLTPRVDVSIRTRGDHEAPPWVAELAYSGTTEYESDDVSVPAGVAFSGTQQVAAGSCGDTYTFRGLALPDVSLTGLIRSLVGVDQELEGTVRLHATLNSCELDEEQRQFSFRVQEFGNLKIGGWRSAR
ncbi:MAG: hypothetical protein WEA04_01905 [Candidatus Andersenbacteria bacterium]